MTIGLVAARRVGWIDVLPPQKLARSIAGDRPRRQLSWIGTAIHTSIGAGAGTAYAAAVGSGRRQGPLTGVAYALAVWMMGYEIVMPMLTDIVPAHRDDRHRAAAIATAHVIYGLTLGAITSRLFLNYRRRA
jgi:hypothetical protein